MWYRVRGAAGLGEALAAARGTSGLTQEQLANRLRVDRTTVLAMEAGRNPALGRLVRAFSLLGYDLVAVPRTATVRVEEGSAADGESP